MNSPDLATLTAELQQTAKTVRESAKTKIKQFPGTRKARRKPSDDEDDEPTEKRPLFSDLLGWLDGKLTQELPTIAPVTANRTLFYKACVNEIHGEPGLGKSNIVAASIIAEIKAGGSVLNLDPEDTAKGFVQKLRSLSCDDPEVLQAIRDGRIKYVHNPEPDMIKEAIVWAVEHKTTFVVMDGLAELMAQEDLNEDLAGDVLKFFRRRVRPFCEKAGSSVLVSDHVSKSSNGMYARGSGSKKGRYDGVSYELTLGKAYSPTVAGYVKLKVTKDRKGGVGTQGAHVVDLHLVPGDKGTELRWEEPTFVVEKDTTAPLIEIENAILEHLRAMPNNTDSKGGIRSAVKGRANTIDQVAMSMAKARRLTISANGKAVYLSIPKQEKPNEEDQLDPADYKPKAEPKEKKTTTAANPGRGKL